MNDTKIEWCDATINLWWGCMKVSPGCANCYAETLDKRNLHGQGNHWGKGVPRMDKRLPAIKAALALDRKAQREDRRISVFNSMNDWLDEEVPIQWLADLLGVIQVTPNLDWLLLTKRPEIWKRRVDYLCSDLDALNNPDLYEFALAWLGGEAPKNVWVGTSVEDQQRADERIPELLNIPANVRFLSCEPLLGFVELMRNGVWSLEDGGIHWVICGGESGSKARPFALNWARDLRNQCCVANVPFFMKQMGAYLIKNVTPPISLYGDADSYAKRINLKSKKGNDPTEWPEDLRVREFVEADKGEDE